MSGARLALVVLLAAGCHGGARTAKVPQDKIIFSHEFHKGMEIECAQCHGDVSKSTSLRDGLLPKEAKCLECHAEHKESKDCGFCHTNADRPGSYAARPRDIEIPHAKHAAKPCATCHVSLPESNSPPPPRPTMSLCTSCHNHDQDYAQTRCEPCHRDLWRFPVQPVATFTHQGNFLREHAAQARTSAATCGRCHDQTFCSDCHGKTMPRRVELLFPEEVLRRFIHRDGYVTAHALDVRADPASCQRCHGTTFCESCHEQQRLTTTVASPRNPHPAGWSFPGGANFHGEAARRDIASCAGCHDQGAASVCVTCHRVGGVGGNPHPAGFLKHHDMEEARSEGMCLACHR